MCVFLREVGSWVVSAEGGGRVGAATSKEAGLSVAASMAELMAATQDSTSGSSRAMNRYSAPFASLHSAQRKGQPNHIICKGCQMYS